MKTLEKELYRGELCQAVKKEYRLLLAVKISDLEAEKRTIDYCMQEYVSNNQDEGRMWLALALVQWNLGRLSEETKAKALHWLKDETIAVSEYARCKLSEVLETPMPAKKNVPKPSWVTRCPWPVGSLLAYRIMSSESPHVTNSSYWQKYVLLRVIAIPSTPVSWLAPEAMRSESMLVGLYNWYGDALPDASIADKLEFTAIEVSRPLLPKSIQSFSAGEDLSSDLTNALNHLKDAALEPRIETCCCLDWLCVKGIDRKKVFTYLGCDPDYSLPNPDFFKTHMTQYSIAHSIPFDAMLVNRLRQLESSDSSQSE